MSAELQVIQERALVNVDFTREQVELVKSQIMNGASDGELQLFLATCKRLQLDPFARHVFAVKRWSQDRGEKWETQVSIDGFRLVASRSGDYQGQTAPQWCGADGHWADVWLAKEPPHAARVGVWRRDFREPAWGIARYDSYVQVKKDRSPMRQWANMPDVMLAKCAEALALRKAFPNDLSGVYTREEMGHAENEAQEHSLANATRGTNREDDSLKARATAHAGLSDELVCKLIDGAWTPEDVGMLIKRHRPDAVGDKSHPVHVHGAKAVAKLRIAFNAAKELEVRTAAAPATTVNTEASTFHDAPVTDASGQEP